MRVAEETVEHVVHRDVLSLMAVGVPLRRFGRGVGPSVDDGLHLVAVQSEESVELVTGEVGAVD